MTTSKRAEWARFAAVRAEPPDVFAPEELAGLPEPARRWLRHAIAPGTALARSVTHTIKYQFGSASASPTTQPHRPRGQWPFATITGSEATDTSPGHH